MGPDVLMLVQTIAIVGGIVTMILRIGRRDAVLSQTDEALKHLRAITQDLVKSVVESTTTQQHHAETMRDLKHRIEALERSR